MEIDSLINVDRVVASKGIMSASVISCGQDNVLETAFRCLI